MLHVSSSIYIILPFEAHLYSFYSDGRGNPKADKPGPGIDIIGTPFDVPDVRIRT